MQFVRTLKHVRRRIYALRILVPGLRHRHRLEAMVGPLGFWKELQQYQLNAVMQLGLRSTHTLLDLGCGPLQGGEMFIRYLGPQQYAGIDHRRTAIDVGHDQIARKRLGDKNPLLLYSQTFGDSELGSMVFDFIWASQVLYYFDEPAMHRLFAMVSRRLKPAGIMAGDILGASADRSFLRPPIPPIHSGRSIDVIARQHGLQVVELGTIQDFGYPRPLGLRTNLLLEITHIGRPSSQPYKEASCPSIAEPNQNPQTIGDSVWHPSSTAGNLGAKPVRPQSVQSIVNPFKL